jgi:signal transduction histidine kinase
LQSLVELLAGVAEAQGAALWTLVGEDASLLATSGDLPIGDPDPVTAAALTSRTLAFPATSDGPVPIRGSLPFSYADGSRGALTLFGTGRLSEETFDVLADLLETLPDVCGLLWERQTLALVQGCGEILHDADLESAELPLPPERLAHHFGRVCELVGTALGCADVSLYLQEPPGQMFPLFATCTGPPSVPAVVRRGVGWTGKAIAAAAPRAVPVIADGEDRDHAGGRRRRKTGIRTLLAVPLLSGQRVWGALRCSGTADSRRNLTPTDLAVLAPVVGQLAQYWSNWLHRRMISGENESWRRLAAGITAFNKLLSDRLWRGAANDDVVYETALDIIRGVIPEAVGCTVRRFVPPQDGGPRLALARTAGVCGDHDSRTYHRGGPLAMAAYRSGQQRWTTDAPAIAAEPVPPATQWLVCTPIRVSNREYGVVEVFGATPTLPPNSPQVCEIIGDQLGLYQYLQQTHDHLQDARTKLQSAVRGQAEALEDLEHQLVGPLIIATNRTERVLAGGRYDSRSEAQLRAVRGLCRKASRVALSAGVFAVLSKGNAPVPKLELMGVDDLVRLLIAAADDAQLLSNPKRNIEFTVQRDSVRDLGRRLIQADRSFLEQCVGNLFDNAAKYSYVDTTVVARGTMFGGNFGIRVTSTGLAMTPAEAARCLERNWRGVAARTSTGEGSGLGLWIVDSLMQAMHGTVRVLPGGDETTVLLSFPLA